MAILVTGGAGFIGSHLIEQLLTTSDDTIICLDNFNDYYSPAQKRANVAPWRDERRIRVVEQDICDATVVEALFARGDIRQVMHLAAYAGVRASVSRPELFVHNNISGTTVLLEAARRRPVERFVLASSSTVYGHGMPGPFVEDAPLGVPLSPYGVTKRATELLGFNYRLLHEVPVVCIRPFSVYGPRLRPDLALSIFAEAILAGRPLPLFGDGTARRDFTYVSDVCSGLLAALTRPGVEGEAINLGHDQPITMREVIDGLGRALGRPVMIDQQPEKPGDMPTTHADLSKARRLLGYAPRVEFEQGIRQFVDWYVDRRQHN